MASDLKTNLSESESKLYQFIQAITAAQNLSDGEMTQLCALVEGADLSWFDKKELAMMLVNLPIENPLVKNITWSVYSKIPEIAFYVGELAQKSEYHERAVMRLLDMYRMDLLGLHNGDPATSVLIYLLSHNLAYIEEPEIFDELKHKHQRISSFICRVKSSTRGFVERLLGKNKFKWLLRLSPEELTSEIRHDRINIERLERILGSAHRILVESQNLEQKLRAYNILTIIYAELTKKFDENPEEIVLFILSCPYLSEWWKCVIRQSSWLFGNNLGAILRGALPSGLFTHEITELFVDVAVFGDESSTLYQHLLMAIEQEELKIDLFNSILQRRYPHQYEAVLKKINKELQELDSGLFGQSLLESPSVTLVERLASKKIKEIFEDEIRHLERLGLKFSKRKLSSIERRVRNRSLEDIENWHRSLPNEFKLNSSKDNLQMDTIIRSYIRFELYSASVKLLNVIKLPVYCHARLCMMMATGRVKAPQWVLIALIKFVTAQELNFDERLLIRFLGFELGVTSESLDRGFYSTFVENLARRGELLYDIGHIPVKGKNYRVLMHADRYFVLQVGSGLYVLNFINQRLYPIIRELPPDATFSVTNFLRKASPKRFFKTNMFVLHINSALGSLVRFLILEGEAPTVLEEIFKVDNRDFFFVITKEGISEIIGLRLDYVVTKISEYPKWNGKILKTQIIGPSYVSQIKSLRYYGPFEQDTPTGSMEWLEIKTNDSTFYVNTITGKLYSGDELEKFTCSNSEIRDVEQYGKPINCDDLVGDFFAPGCHEPSLIKRQQEEALWALRFYSVSSRKTTSLLDFSSIYTTDNKLFYLVVSKDKRDNPPYSIVLIRRKDLDRVADMSEFYPFETRCRFIENSRCMSQCGPGPWIYFDVFWKVWSPHGYCHYSRRAVAPFRPVSQISGPYRFSYLDGEVVISSISGSRLEIWTSKFGLKRINLSHRYVDFVPFQILQNQDATYLVGALYTKEYKLSLDETPWALVVFKL
ncbi:MAG: hypothetical protein NZO16_05575 [Deltaproteobacteria bacterium]|nr:hypothetical protein [Deltaproteobacteria bacterium]